MAPSLSPSCTFQVAQFPCLNDNYGYLIHDEKTGHTAAIDTPDAKAYSAELKRRGWELTHILNTHHHYDHTGGNTELKLANKQIRIVGPGKEKIPGLDEGVQGGDEVVFGSTKARVIDVGGHTIGHIAYYFENDGVAFVGDSLFALGCGKMFEGTPVQFWESLLRLRNLPDETTVYCAHEYTASNAKFAKSVEPGNPDLISRIKEIESLLKAGKPTVPSTIGEEKRTNPFLRCDSSEEIRNNVGITAADADSVAFAKVRKAKDRF